MHAEIRPELLPRPLMDQYLNYLLIEKGLSANTLDSYRADLNRFADFLHAGGIRSLCEADSPVILRHLICLRDSGMGSRSRGPASGNPEGIFQVSGPGKILEQNPAKKARSAQKRPEAPDVLSVQEINQLLNMPNPKTRGHSQRRHDRADVRRRASGRSW